MNLKNRKSGLLGGVAVAALAASFVAGGIASPVTPVLADAVKVEAPQAPSFADVVEAVSPAVVSVRVKASVEPASDRTFGFDFDGIPDDHPLKRFFDFGERGQQHFFERRNRRGERRMPRRFGMSQGSGFFVSEDGYIVTNNHVIDKGSKFTVVLNDGEEVDAKLIGTDAKTDLAVLKIDADREFTYVNFSDSPSRVGDWVVAVGNPFGLGGTVTAGIVSASNRDIGSGPYDDFIQIDAAVNKGNSGGPAFNLSGEVIGVNTAIFSPSGGNVGIAFAISARSANEVVTDLIENGTVTRGWLGVQIQPVTKDIAASIGLDNAAGAIVSEAQSGSPAEKAGLLSGDVILKVDDKSVKGPKELARIVAGYEPAETAKLTIFRDGGEKIVDVKLGSFPNATKKASVPAPNLDSDTAAIDIDELGMAIMEGPDGVSVESVTPDGVADEKGVRAGDLIKSINGREIASANDVGKAVSEAMEEDRKAILFQLRSGERSRFVALPVQRG